MGQIKDFIAGTRPSASHLNELVAVCNRAADLRGDGLIAVHGNTIGLNMGMVRERIGHKPFTTIAVTVEMDGGAAGSASTECSWTYTVKDLAGNTLATAVTPETPRLHYTAYFYAGETRTLPNVATSVYGLAVWFGATLVLLQAYGEIAKQETC